MLARRLLPIALLLVAAVAFTGCGRTTAVVASAQSISINAVGDCGAADGCSAKVIVTQVRTGKTHVSLAESVPNGSGQSIWHTVNGLLPNTEYTYQACGRARGLQNAPLVCVGPGGPDTSGRITTKPL